MGQIVKQLSNQSTRYYWYPGDKREWLRGGIALAAGATAYLVLHLLTGRTLLAAVVGTSVTAAMAGLNFGRRDTRELARFAEAAKSKPARRQTALHTGHAIWRGLAEGAGGAAAAVLIVNLRQSGVWADWLLPIVPAVVGALAHQIGGMYEHLGTSKSTDGPAKRLAEANAKSAALAEAKTAKQAVPAAANPAAPAPAETGADAPTASPLNQPVPITTPAPLTARIEQPVPLTARQPVSPAAPNVPWSKSVQWSKPRTGAKPIPGAEPLPGADALPDAVPVKPAVLVNATVADASTAGAGANAAGAKAEAAGTGGKPRHAAPDTIVVPASAIAMSPMHPPVVLPPSVTTFTTARPPMPLSAALARRKETAVLVSALDLDGAG